MKNYRVIAAGIAGIVVLISGILLAASLTTIHPGHVGVSVKKCGGGGVSSNPIPTGYYWRSLFCEDVVEYPLGPLAVRDLSTGGAFIRTSNAPSPKAEVGLTLHSLRLPEPIKVTALVRSRRSYGFGVEFLHFHGRGQLQLADLLATLVVPRILVVSHEPDIRRSLTRLLNKENYSALTAEDGPEALLLASESQIDMVIADLDLPGSQSGVQTVQQLRALSHLQHVPILVLTASSEPTRLASAHDLGVLGSMAKPPQLDKLLGFVRTLLDQ